MFGAKALDLVADGIPGTLIWVELILHFQEFLAATIASFSQFTNFVG